MTQLPLYMLLWVIGVAWALAIGPRHRPSICCALGFPLGLATTVLGLLPLLVLGVPFGSVTIFSFALLQLVAVILISKNRPLERYVLRTVALWGIGFAVVAALLCSWNLSLMSFDSHHMVMLAGVIAENGSMDDRLILELSAWSTFLIGSQALVAATFETYLYALQPILGVSMLATFTLLLHEAVRSQSLSARATLALCLVFAAALLSNYAVLFQIFFVHSNLGSALYLFLFVVMFWRATITGERRWLPIAFIALVAFSFHRIEAPLMAVLAFAVVVFPSKLPAAWLRAGVCSFTAIVSAWYVFLSFYVPANSAFLTPSRAIILAAAVAGTAGVWLAVQRPSLSGLRRYVPRLASVAVALVLAIMFALKTEHMVTTVSNLATNLWGLPHWGLLWSAAAVATLLSLVAPPPESSGMFLQVVALILGAILALAFFRSPYRNAMLDSGNRMAMHVVPLIFYAVAIRAIPALAPSTSVAEST